MRPGSPPEAFAWFDSGHPEPDEQSVEAGRQALALAAASRTGSVLVVLLSGGASAMLACPAEGVTLEDKVETTRALLEQGASIEELNAVRRHLSGVKGGGLALAAGRTATLAISDVHWPIPDDPAVIGSGPTAADPTTYSDALRVARRYAHLPPAALRRLERGAAGELPETVKPGDPRLASSSFTVIGNRLTALRGASRAAEAREYDVATVEMPTHGEARQATAAFLVAARRQAGAGGRPMCLLAAGETTVRVRGPGLGGRNQEFALAAVPAVGSFGRAAVLASAGTDGIDGPTDAAGAVVDSTTLERSARAGLDWRRALADNDAYRFFATLHDLIVWGPTGTNVGDIQVLLLA